MKLDKILEFIVSVAHCQSITTVYCNLPNNQTNNSNNCIFHLLPPK